MIPNANIAIEILEKIQVTCGNATLAYWVLPNAILTLSGARAYCDGVFWHDNQKLLEHWDKEIKKSMAVVKKNTEVIVSVTGIQSVRDNESYASYELVLGNGLNYVLNQTTLLGGISLQLDVRDLTLEKLSANMVNALRNQAQFKKYSNENLNHIAFGLLVGYPDIAITESVESWQKDDPFMEAFVDANIRGARYYTCPMPIYSYPRHLLTDPTIVTNEQLWSQILQTYYSSAFHKQLEAQPDFISKMQELKNFR